MKNLIFIFLMFISFTSEAQQEEITKFIKSESIGGKLDFTKVAEEQAKGAYFIRFGDVLYNKNDFAILMWGAKVKQLKIESLEKATQLWEEINNRSLTEAERRAMKIGFEIELEN